MNFSGSVLAHGLVDHLVVATPEPPLGDLAGNISVAILPCSRGPAMKRQETKRRATLRAAGVTLVELLVVGTILAVLAGLLLPVLSRCKASARKVTCTSNLRQLGFAAHMYWDDNGGQTFPYFVARTNGGQIYWFGWIQDGNEGERALDETVGALYPYLQGRGVEICPAFNYGSSKYKLKASGASYGYGYNLNLAPRGRAPRKISELSAPVEIALFADAAQVNTWQAPASAGNPLLEEWYYIDENVRQPNGHFRHQHTANVVFCDGHADSEAPVPGSLDTRLPQEWVGRLRTEILEAK